MERIEFYRERDPYGEFSNCAPFPVEIDGTGPVMNKQLVEISKFLSFLLRHKPRAIGITLDAEGWVAIDELLAAAAHHGQSVTRQQVEEVVATNDKQRFIGSSGLRTVSGSRRACHQSICGSSGLQMLYHARRSYRWLTC
jgi:RNA:NAD 2'-phosphotransferase (TPT1/KptA family)